MRALSKNNIINSNIKNVSNNNKERIVQLLGLATRARKTTFGTDAVTMAMAKGNVKMVFVSNEASENTKNKFINKCEYYKSNIIMGLSVADLQKATGKENLMVLGVLDKGFINNLNNLLKEDVKNES